MKTFRVPRHLNKFGFHHNNGTYKASQRQQIENRHARPRFNSTNLSEHEQIENDNNVLLAAWVRVCVLSLFFFLLYSKLINENKHKVWIYIQRACSVWLYARVLLICYLVAITRRGILRLLFAREQKYDTYSKIEHSLQMKNNAIHI